MSYRRVCCNSCGAPLGAYLAHCSYCLTAQPIMGENVKLQTYNMVRLGEQGHRPRQPLPDIR